MKTLKHIDPLMFLTMVWFAFTIGLIVMYTKQGQELKQAQRDLSILKANACMYCDNNRLRNNLRK